MSNLNLQACLNPSTRSFRQIIFDRRPAYSPVVTLQSIHQNPTSPIAQVSQPNPSPTPSESVPQQIVDVIQQLHTKNQELHDIIANLENKNYILHNEIIGLTGLLGLHEATSAISMSELHLRNVKQELNDILAKLKILHSLREINKAMEKTQTGAENPEWVAAKSGSRT